MSFSSLIIYIVLLIGYTASNKCGLNEVYSTCGPPIEASCETLGHPQFTDKSCHKGCFCQDGFVRDKTSNCIKIGACPKPPKCPQHETFSQVGNVSSCSEPTVETIQKPGCYCNKNYVRNDNGKCIPWQNCPCSDPNEIYTDCVPIKPKTCFHRSNSPKHDKCRSNWKGCACQPNYVYHDGTSVCTLEEECPPSPCQIKCAKQNAKYVSCVKNIHCDMADNQWDGKCRHGCQCNPGYARDDFHRCIPLEECPCPEYSTFKVDSAACPKTCGNSLADRCNDTLPAGCECNPGYVLNSKGDCILLEECKEEEIFCPNNLKYSRYGYLHRCEDVGKMIKVVPTKGCFCPEGLFYRSDKKLCVLPQECPTSPENKECEQIDKRLEYRHCQYPGCVKTCSNPYVIDCTRGKCNSGCYCRDGYILKSYANKTCVKLDECTCVENASYKSCAKAVSDSCEQMYQRGLAQIALCVEKCECNDGYYLNSNYNCVLEKDCLPREIKCNSNFVLTLTEADFLTCGQTSPEIVTRGCICEKGYQYDPYRNKCVVPSECTNSDNNIECARENPNKVYYDRASSSCVSTCDDPEGTDCTLPFTSGCYCKPGLIQISPDDGTCVLPSQCPSYEVLCLNNTIATFAGYRHYCSQDSIFVENNCICPNGLKFDEVKATCVEPRECTESPENLDCYTQDANLEFRGCQSSSCVATCETPTFEMCTADCQMGCFCKIGLLQVSKTNTSCVLPEECPTTNCGPHAHYSTCASCPSQCSTIHLGLRCPKYCNGVPTCVCDPGYAFTNTGKCVLNKDCPADEVECPGNQIYSGKKVLFINVARRNLK